MATRSQQIEILAAGVLFDGATIATPYAAFYAAGTTTAKNAFADVDKAVAITKKALDAQGRAIVYGDGIYKIRIYSGDPDNGGVLKFEIDNYKVTAVAGNTRTVTSATVAGSADDSLVEANTTSNNILYTLPDAALMSARIIQIAKSADGNTLTVAAASGQLVNGAASVAYTAQYATGVFQSNGTNWYVFQTVGDATTLGTYSADTGVTAETIPVRDVNGVIPGSAAKVGVLNVKVIDIGDWDMDTNSTVVITHGLDYTKIRQLSAIIREDTGILMYGLDTDSGSGTGFQGYALGGTTVTLYRETGGVFDNTDFNSTAYNRGWVTIWYVD